MFDDKKYMVNFYNGDEKEEFITRFETDNIPLIPQIGSIVYVDGLIDKNASEADKDNFLNFENLPLVVEDVRYSYSRRYFVEEDLKVYIEIIVKYKGEI